MENNKEPKPNSQQPHTSIQHQITSSGSTPPVQQEIAKTKFWGYYRGIFNFSVFAILSTILVVWLCLWLSFFPVFILIALAGLFFKQPIMLLLPVGFHILLFIGTFGLIGPISLLGILFAILGSIGQARLNKLNKKLLGAAKTKKAHKPKEPSTSTEALD